jgi:hypothetical protein
MKRIILFIAVIICFLSFPGRVPGQSDIHYIKLKEFLNDYQNSAILFEWNWIVDNFGNDVEELVEVKSSVTLFNGLLFDNCVLYFDLEPSGYLTYTASEYIEAYKRLLVSNDIRIHSVEIKDFNIKSTRPGGILLIELTKNVFYDPRKFDRAMDPTAPLEQITSHLVMTLLYDCLNSRYKLLKIDRDEHLLSDGLGSSRLIPQSLTVKSSYLLNSMSHDHLSTLDGTGFDFTLKANYLIAGSKRHNNYNLYFSPGIRYFHNKFSYTTTGFPLPEIEQYDIDDQMFTLIIEGDLLEQQSSFDYIGIPLDLGILWKPGRINFSFEAGLLYGFPVNMNNEITDANLTYKGQYLLPQPPDPEFGQETYLFENLPAYGFKDYSAGDFAGITEIELNQVIMGHLGINLGYDIDPRWRIGIGAQVYSSLNDLVKPAAIDSLIGAGASICPNLLAYEAKSTSTSVGFEIGITYNLKRVNIPYHPNLKYKNIDEYICERKERPVCGDLSTASINTRELPINLFIENDADMPAKAKSFAFNYCGISKANSQQGKMKLGKSYGFKVEVPVDDRKTSQVQFAIRKPYMVDIYADNIIPETDNEYFILNYSALNELSIKGSLTLYAKDIPEIDIYYVSKSQNPDPDYNPMEFKTWLGDYICNESRKTTHEVLLYCAYKDEASAMLTTSDDCDSIQKFCDMVYDFYPQGIFNDKVIFENVLRNVPCDRRDVNLYFLLDSPYAYVDEYLKMQEEVILEVLNDKFEKNYEHVHIKIVLPYDRMNLTHKENQMLNNIFELDKKPINAFDFEFINYKDLIK